MAIARISQKHAIAHSTTSRVLGYNRLVDHVGIHGQRRLTEALNKDLLVWQKEYPTESSSKSRESVYIETSTRHSREILEQWSVNIGIPKSSRETIDKYRGAVMTTLVNAAYRAVAFTGSMPGSDKETTLPWIAGQNLPYLTKGGSENHN
ncbi:hypothetical protein Taro_032131 [Colocasia esculenta]|uniref:Uncharacterized protein n=1 Tax=Colocasia esculenta TaxID=4460 RepID=A0A843VYF5_COLES|nr:hypothetical protein [Colocasia esculenta]